MNTQDYVDAAAVIAEELRIEVSTVLLAIAELRNCVTGLEQALGEQNYDRASTIGYQEITLAFVDLQRCLGGVQVLLLEEHMLVQEIVREQKCSEDEARRILASAQRQT